MNRGYVCLALAICLTLCVVGEWGSAAAAAKTSNKGSVTGTYRREVEGASGQSDVLQLPHHRIRFYLLARWHDHIGEVKGTTTLKNGYAVYKQEKGGLHLHFMRGRVDVTQVGSGSDNDFGMNVSATGTYTRRSRRAPKFPRPMNAK